MVLDWFSRAKPTSVDDLIARKNYTKAAAILRTELERRRNDQRLRIQLGDVLAMAGRAKEAVEIFMALADDLALGGNAAKAIALLKKVQRHDPGNADAEEKLAYLVTQLSQPSRDPWARRKQPTVEFGMEEIAVEPEANAASDAPAAEPAAGAAAVSETAQDDFFVDDGIRDELVALIETALTLRSDTAATADTGNRSLVETPLFRGFSHDELVAVVGGLRLLSFEPGEILVTEGEAGHSLFILTTGRVRAYVRHTSGRSAQVRELHEGDFFGEISLLRGGARTATITAASHCELLELDKPTLDAILASHPRVLDVLQEFYDQRAGTTLEAMVRGESTPA
jgi:hypothetical protein